MRREKESGWVVGQIVFMVSMVIGSRFFLSSLNEANDEEPNEGQFNGGNVRRDFPCRFNPIGCPGG